MSFYRFNAVLPYNKWCFIRNKSFISKMAPKYQFDANDLVQNGKVPKEIFAELKEWSMNQNLPLLSDEQLVIFLISCYNDVKATKVTIYQHFKCKQGAPELFFNRNWNSEDLQKMMKVCHCCLMPKRTSKGDAVLLGRLVDTSYHKFHIEPLLKLSLMVGELLYHDPPEGVIIIVDLKGFGLFHITKLRPSPLKKFFNFVQTGYGCRIKQIHIVNTVYFIDKIMFILKPLMSKELYNLIKIHSTSMNMSHFHEKYVAKDVLPKDYGGCLDEHRVLTLQVYETFKGMGKFFEDEEQQVKEFATMHEKL